MSKRVLIEPVTEVLAPGLVLSPEVAMQLIGGVPQPSPSCRPGTPLARPGMLRYPKLPGAQPPGPPPTETSFRPTPTRPSKSNSPALVSSVGLQIITGGTLQ